MFFQLWQVRADPYRVLADGDTLWWVDQRTREVRWQMTVRNVRRRQCASIESAREYLRRWFGVFPGDLSSYKADGSFRNGWLLAWENEVVAPVGISLPDGVRLGRNGFRRLDDHERSELGLRPSRRKVLRPVEPLEDQELLGPPRERAVPAETARQVWQRDGRECRHCGDTSGPFHLDHIYPWSKGGPNTLENLQVLCISCNLSKAARVTGDLRPEVPGLFALAEMAERVGRPTPSTARQLRQLLESAARSQAPDDMIELVLQIVTHDDAAMEVIVATIESLRGHNKELEVWARAIYGLVVQDVDKGLLKLVEHDSDLGSAACAHALLHLDLETSIRKKYARRAAQCTFDTIAAIGHYEFAMSLSSSGTSSMKHFQTAFERGSPALAADAALAIGILSADRSSAVEYLLYAVRARSSEVAAAAAEAMAARFLDEPEIAAYYSDRAAELRAG
jgi:hypothetical protein